MTPPWEELSCIFFQSARIDFDFRHLLRAIRGASPAAQGERGSARARSAGGCRGHPALARWGDTVPSPTGSTRQRQAHVSRPAFCIQSTQKQLDEGKGSRRPRAAERVRTVLEARGHGQPGLGQPQPSPRWEPSEGVGAEHHRLPASSSPVPFPALLRSPCCHYLSVKSNGFPAISCRTTQVPRSLCWKA